MSRLTIDYLLDTFCCCFQSWEGKFEQSSDERQILSRRQGQYGTAESSTHIPSSTATSLHQSLNAASLGVKRIDGSVISYMKMRPTSVYIVDKRFQDHAALYNKYLDVFAELIAALKDLMRFGKFRDQVIEVLDEALTRTTQTSSESNDITSRNVMLEMALKQSFNRMQRLTAGVSSLRFTQPTRHCVQLIYEPRDLHHDVIPAILTFNSISMHTKDVLDKAPTLRGALEMVVDNSRDLRREVLVASLGADGPNCLDNCDRNLSVISESVPYVTEIESFARFLLDIFKNSKIGR